MRTKPIFHACTMAAALLAAGCSIQEQKGPSISGPSEFGLSLNASVSSLTVQRDGVSQSTIVVTARDDRGGPVSGRRILLNVAGPTSTRLSDVEVTTDSAGRATFTVTAPERNSVGDTIEVYMTALGGDGFPMRVAGQVAIGVTPSNTGAPTAQFTFSPATPAVNEQISFNGSTSTDDGRTCGQACSYAWDFGDGTTATGMIATKSYATSGNRSVTLVVTDAAGASSLPHSQTVSVAPPAAPLVGTVGVSPTPVRPNQTTYFDAGGATVGAGATIVDYTWVWGDGSSAETTTTPQASHTFSSVGTYTVRTTVRDSLGRTASVTTTVTVATP